MAVQYHENHMACPEFLPLIAKIFINPGKPLALACYFVYNRISVCPKGMDNKEEAPKGIPYVQKAWTIRRKRPRASHMSKKHGQ